VHQQIKILGKVIWRKVINENESYEFGVEFYPSKEIETLEDYISGQLKSNKSEFVKNKLPPIDSGNKNIVETKKVPPIKNKQWIKIAIISLGTIVLIVVLLKIFGSISLDFICPHTNKKVTNNYAHDSMTTESATLPAPSIIAPVQKVTSTPVPAPAPKQKTKVIGNSDSKIYHLPGMKYNNAVKAHHRVEFDSGTIVAASPHYYEGIKGIVLKNGKVIEGQIISIDDNDVLKIQTKEGKILSYSFMKEVKEYITE
jgi:hypothetical protein